MTPMERSIVEFMMKEPFTREGIHVSRIARAVGKDAYMIKSVDAFDHLASAF
jgi:hypothetical protein